MTRSLSTLLLLSLALAPLAAQDAVTARVQPYPIDLPPEFEAAIQNGTRTANGRPGPNYWTNYA